MISPDYSFWHDSQQVINMYPFDIQMDENPVNEVQTDETHPAAQPIKGFHPFEYLIGDLLKLIFIDITSGNDIAVCSRVCKRWYENIGFKVETYKAGLFKRQHVTEKAQKVMRDYYTFTDKPHFNFRFLAPERQNDIQLCKFEGEHLLFKRFGEPLHVMSHVLSDTSNGEKTMNIQSYNEFKEDLQCIAVGNKIWGNPQSPSYVEIEN